MSDKSHSRFYELDTFRGIAALGVVLFHYTSNYDRLFDHSDALWFEFGWGKRGVELFFIISGFVIFLTLNRTQRSGDFWVSRCARLFPPYWVAIILTFAVVRLLDLPGRGTSIPNTVFNFSMVHGFFGIPHVDGVYWTLQVELSFYVLMFGLYFWRQLRRIDGIVLGWLAIATCYTLDTSMLHTGLFTGISPEAIDKVALPMQIRAFLEALLILPHAPAFIIGILLYQMQKHEFTLQRGLTLLLCFVPTLIADYAKGNYQVTLTMAIGVGLFYLAFKGYLKFLRVKPLLFLGSISYSLYLIHQNVGYSIIHRLYQYGVNPNLSVMIAILVSMAIATLMTMWVERPVLRWVRDRRQRSPLQNLPS
jgi:peptidoglycan/LPS O-acetylase OafA/YrhL